MNVVPIRPQSDREIAELIAKFRTPPMLDWKPLADDIETVLNMRSASARKESASSSEVTR